MSSSFSLAPNPRIIGDRKGTKFLPRRSTLIMSRADVIAEPKSKNFRRLNFPTLSKQGIPLADLHVEEIVQRQSQANPFSGEDSCKELRLHPSFLEKAYESCRRICAEYAKTFYLGTLLMTKERQRAIWAIYGKKRKSKVKIQFRKGSTFFFLLVKFGVGEQMNLWTAPMLFT